MHIAWRSFQKMPDEIQIITTGDGSHSLLNTALNETYHSVHGARQESIHVFIKHGLEFFLEKNRADVVDIFEVGFGTGLNALLTAAFAQEQKQKINYTSIETFPLAPDIWSKLNYSQTESDRILFEMLHAGSWQSKNVMNEFFTIQKLEKKLQEISFRDSFDVVYFDAFAPSKQPELWEISVLQKVYEALKINGIFVTYCAKGQLKRDLKTLGFLVETHVGPPGKKEMVRAVKIS